MYPTENFDIPQYNSNFQGVHYFFRGIIETPMKESWNTLLMPLEQPWNTLETPFDET